MKNSSSPAPLMFRLMMILIAAGLIAPVSQAQELAAASEAEAQSALPEAVGQSPRIFVASFGNDANNGTRPSPKRNFQAAHNALTAGGEIVVVDTAVYGPLTITKSVSVIAPPGVNGIISVSGGANGITMNPPSNIGVILRGLVIEGGGQSQGNCGILALKTANLVVEDCSIRAFNHGIFQETPGSSTSLNNSILLGCYNGLNLNISAAAGATANVNHCRFELNGGVGLNAANNNSSSGGTVTVTAADSIFYRNGSGIRAASGTHAGITSNVLVSNCVITDNVAGVVLSGIAYVRSRGNNTLSNNGSGNSFNASYNAQ